MTKSGRHSIGTPGEIMKSKPVVTTVTKGKQKETTFDVVASKSTIYIKVAETTIIFGAIDGY